LPYLCTKFDCMLPEDATSRSSLDDEDTPTGKPATPRGEMYVFAVAIDQYNQKLGLPDLANPVNDAHRMIEVLLRRFAVTSDDANPADLRMADPDHYGMAPNAIPVYNGKKLKCLYNEEANWRNIKAHLDTICQKNTENDQLIFYFSGHGEADKDKGSIYLHRNKPIDNAQIGYDELCYDLLDNYLLNKKFRHILYIFDCCFAGAFNLGKGGNMENDHFSRYALTSCNADQTAADRSRENRDGSPFSVALTKILDSTGANGFTTEAIKKDLESSVGRQTGGKQQVEYGQMGAKMNGKGQFQFFLKSDIRKAWNVGQLKDSILYDLDFEGQKAQITNRYVAAKNRFNIFSTCSETENVQKMLTKAMFQHPHIKTDSALNLYNPDTIHLDATISGLWEALLRQKDGMAPFETPEIKQVTKENIIDWIIGRLMSTTQGNPLTIIFKGEMSLIAQDIVKWSTEFYQIFKEKADKSTEPLNKIIFLFQEIKNGKTKIKDDLFEEEPINKEINIVITPFVEPIRPPHIDSWIKSLPPELRKINDLKEWSPQDFKPAGIPTDDYTYPHQQFIELIFVKFEVDNDGKAQIIKSLYDF